MNALVIDGERPVRCSFRLKLTRFLEQQGHVVTVAGSGVKRADGATPGHPDMVLILDLGALSLSGLEACRQLREWTQAPVIILSVREGEQQKITAFELGADDYVTKPFHLGELLARMKAVLRRCGAQDAAGLQFSMGGLSIDYTRRRVVRSGEELHLTPIEYELLRHLTLNSGQVLTHEQLLGKVWGKEHEEDSHTLRVHIANLRRKIERGSSHPRFLQTEPRIGYRFRAEC